MSELDIYFPDYKPNPEVDDDTMLHIKEAVDALPFLDKKIFLQYAELGTYTGLAKLYGVTPPTAKKYIDRIRGKIYNNL